MASRALPLVALLISVPAFAGSYRIVGGQPVALHEWPDAAAICWGPSCNYNSVECTGTLIGPDVVITAGHCVAGDPPVAVRLDSSDLTQDAGEVIQVADAYEYPNSWNTYDIGVLKLEHAAATVAPRALAYGCVQDEDLVDGADVTIVGYGAVNEQGTSYQPQKRQAFTQINDANCTDANDGCNMSVSPGGEIGAGGDGVDTCFGDSGGPIYLNTQYGDYVVGATSRSYQWAGNPPCRDGGIYVRPDAVVDWIFDKTGFQVQETTCNLPPAPTFDGTLEVPIGKVTKKDFDAHDPDQSSGHTWAILEAPAHATAEIDGDGKLQLEPIDDSYLGADSVMLTVTDTEGYPPLSATLVVPLDIVEKGGCGCVTPVGAAPAWLGGLIGALVLGRRRR